MLKSAKLSKNARQLSKMIEKGEAVFDSAVQRRLVWENDRKSLFIHSMIEGYPCPNMYCVDINGKYSFIEGKQRSNCIYDFFNDRFALTNIPEVILDDGTEIDLNGKKYSELPEEIRDIISNYSLNIIFFDKSITEEEIHEVFFRLNNGKPLTNIEQSRSKAVSLDIIQELGKHELFTNSLSAKAFEKYTHEDLVIKTYIMLTEKEPCYDAKVVRPILEKAIITNEQVAELTAIFDRINAAYEQILAEGSKENKKVAKRVITKTHLLSIIPITKRTLDENISLDAYTNWLLNFYNGKKSPTKYDQYNSKATSGSGHLESVRSRLNVINKDFNSFIKYYVPKKVETAEVTEVVEMATENKDNEIAKNDNIITKESNVENMETTENIVDEVANKDTVEEKMPETTSEDMIEDDIPDNIKAILNASEELESGDPYDDMAGITEEILGEVFPDLVAAE